MSMKLDSDDTELLLNAYVDGELDAASALAFDRRLATEPDLAAARDRILAVRGLLRDSIPLEAASEGLRRAMLAHAEAAPGGARPTVLRRFADQARSVARPWSRGLADWRMAAAACLLSAVFGGALTSLLVRSPAENLATTEAVADHLRAVMAPQPFDVASSDQHTVKPWFTGRLPFAPEVFDLGPEGFDLVGGRVDVIEGLPAATLVFRHGKHLISLTSQPVESGAASVSGPASQRGFSVRRWTTGGMRYWAVSDVAPQELDDFQAAAQARLKQEG